VLEAESEISGKRNHETLFAYLAHLWMVSME
jgi:hypothetical protein